MRNLCFLLLGAAGLAAAPARADSLLLTEVVTDPQADHSESAGGNGVPFDLVPGTGSVSVVDEFVEVHNAGTSPVDLTGFLVDFLDSTPSQFVFGATAGSVLTYSAGSSLTALLAGGFVLIGNPPGSLNNRLAILLREPGGAILDSLDIDDGAATSILDEAVGRLWSGQAFLAGTRREPISPLAPGTPVPEPPALVLVLSALACARATARRAPRAAGRRSPGGPRLLP